MLDKITETSGKTKPPIYDEKTQYTDSSDGSSSSSLESFKKIRSNAKLAPDETIKKENPKYQTQMLFSNHDVSFPHHSPQSHSLSKLVNRNENDYEQMLYGQEPFVVESESISSIPDESTHPWKNKESKEITNVFQDKIERDGNILQQVEDEKYGTDIATYQSAADEGKATIDNITNRTCENRVQKESLVFTKKENRIRRTIPEGVPKISYLGRVAYLEEPQGLHLDSERDGLRVKKKRKVYTSSFENPRKTYVLW